MKNYILYSFILFLCACGIDRESTPVSLPSSGTQGQLDTNFFGEGFVSFSGTAGGTGHDEINALAKDSQGRIIAVGYSTNEDGDTDMAVWRLLANGNLDSSFAGQGYFIHDNAAGGNSNDQAYGVAVSSNDDIYITGSSLNASGDLDMVIWKLKSNGALDTTFDGDGYAVFDDAAGGNLHDQGNSIAIDSNGKLVVAGYSFHNGTQRAIAVWRVLTSGTLDTTFNGGSGFYTHENTLDINNQIADSLAFNQAGAIYVVGRADSSTGVTDMAVWKLNSLGQLDTSFATNGIYSENGTAGGNGIDAATSVLVDSDNRVLIVGYSRNSSANNDMVLWRLDATGDLDSSFGTNGISIFDISPTIGWSANDIGDNIVLDSAGQILVTGSSNDDMAVWRYSADGELDTVYGSDGMVIHDSAAGGFAIDSGSCSVIDNEGRLVVGGISKNASGYFEATFWRIK